VNDSGSRYYRVSLRWRNRSPPGTYAVSPRLVKGKVIYVLLIDLTSKYHAGGSGGVAPLILTFALDEIARLHTPIALYPGETSPLTVGGWVGPRVCPNFVKRRKPHVLFGVLVSVRLAVFSEYLRVLELRIFGPCLDYRNTHRVEVAGSPRRR
jgi:hypothetical protein